MIARPRVDEARIEDYALIGDCHGSALVAKDGAIDWACLKRFDADPVLCRLLDPARGGTFTLDLDGGTSRRYLDDTAVLDTVFEGEHGRTRVLDLMPVWRQSTAGTHDYVSLEAPGWIVRRIVCERGTSEGSWTFRPSVAFASQVPTLVTSATRIGTHGCWLYGAGPDTHVGGDTAIGGIHLREGDALWLVVTPASVDWPVVVQQLPRMLDATLAFWREWAAYLRYRGPHTAAVRRSAITLKLLTYAPSGALVAAPTTSLPEALGGTRNWDYRYCWVRDGTLLLYALSALGYHGEAKQFANYLGRACAATVPDLQIMYGIEHEADLPERTLDYLAGYRASRPVRVGNAAFQQVQLDVYGELLDWAHLFQAVGGRFDGPLTALLKAVEQTVIRRWREPDAGLWEDRRPGRHFVFSKAMAWVALDRGMRLFGASRQRQRERDDILQAIVTHGIHERGHLRQAFGEDRTDASLLILPLLGLPIPRDVFRQTVRTIEAELAEGIFIRRYVSDDGLPGAEGAFVICSFWFIDALLCLGERERAEERFAQVLGAANDVGLFSEEVDPATGAFLGNFPQAFSHLALIQTATLFELVNDGGVEALLGTPADRVRRTVGANAGVMGMWAAFRRTGRIGRVWSSRQSRLRL